MVYVPKPILATPIWPTVVLVSLLPLSTTVYVSVPPGIGLGLIVKVAPARATKLPLASRFSQAIERTEERRAGESLEPIVPSATLGAAAVTVTVREGFGSSR